MGQTSLQSTGGKGLSWIAKLGTLSILYVAVFLTRIGFGTMIILFPIYVDAGAAVVGLVLALYPIVEAFSALPVGAYVDRRGRRRAFVLGMALISALTFFVGLTRNVYIIGGAHGLMGLSAAMVTVSSLTMITDLTVVQNRGTGMGAFDLSNLAGYGVGVLFGTVLISLFRNDLGLGFIIVSAVFAAATVSIGFLLREPPHTRVERKTLRQTFTGLSSEVTAILPLWLSVTIILGFYLFLPKIVGQQGDISRSGLLLLVGVIVLGAGAVLFGTLSDRIGRYKTMLIGVVGELGFLLIFPEFLGQLLLAQNASYVYPEDLQHLGNLFNNVSTAVGIIGPIGVVAGVLFFLGTALVPSMLAFVGDKASHDLRGSAMGLYSFMLSIGTAVGTVLAGIFTEIGGVHAVFYLGAAIFSGMSLTTFLLLRKENQIGAVATDFTEAPQKPL